MSLNFALGIFDSPAALHKPPRKIRELATKTPAGTECEFCSENAFDLVGDDPGYRSKLFSGLRSGVRMERQQSVGRSRRIRRRHRHRHRYRYLAGPTSENCTAEYGQD